jgi:hypothetical protein
VIVIVLVALATYRITRLITRDVFHPIAYVRGRIVNKLGPHHWFSYLIMCDWCTSMYVATVVVLLTMLVTSVSLPVLLIFASSGITGFLAAVEPD